MIYFIRCGEFVKIGRARDPQERVAYLQTANPHEVSLIGTIDAPDEEEGRLHSALSTFRHRGEWFFLSKTVSDFIESHCHRQKSQSWVRRKKDVDANVVSFSEKKERNLEVVRLHNLGRSAQEIADTLGLSERHVRRIRAKHVPTHNHPP